MSPWLGFMEDGFISRLDISTVLAWPNLTRLLLIIIITIIITRLTY